MRSIRGPKNGPFFWGACSPSLWAHSTLYKQRIKGKLLSSWPLFTKHQAGISPMHHESKQRRQKAWDDGVASSVHPTGPDKWHVWFWRWKLNSIKIFLRLIPPFAYVKKFCSPLLTWKNSAPPFGFVKKLWFPPPHTHTHKQTPPSW